ncbi:MAG TPA: glycosyltransferase [Candidatus Acidoferrum sp.]
MSETLTLARIPLDNYAGLLSAGEIEELRALAKPLRGRSIEMINSTAIGGGVAEILNRLVPLAEQLDLHFKWNVMTGGQDFFDVTKSFHNALHGAPYHASPRDFEIFLAYTERNRATLPLDSEFVVIHDPQPAALIDARKPGSNHWVWRCHIDLAHPNRAVWDFLEKFVSRYDGAMFSSPEFSRQLPIPQYLFYPAIDPLSEKNQDLEPEFIAQVLARFRIDPMRPILTQISRFDRLKDPVGVIRAYRIVKRYFDCQLVLAGGSASDDPEGAIVLKEALREADNHPDIRVIELPAWAPLEVNALQRASTIVIQKSLREGFGLTVSEALWKKKPVVASAVGGIPIQIIHKHTGLLAHSVEGTAYQIRFLLSHPEIAARLGEHGHQHVKENFLITQKLKRYLTLFLRLARGS